MRWICLLGVLTACGGGNDDDDGDLYDGCVEASDCDAAEDQDPVCLEKGDEGFCTSTCAIDDDCDDPDLVCASFESNAATYCFPSCEDDEEACPPGFGCRSTGGGSDNRKVCFPEE